MTSADAGLEATTGADGALLDGAGHDGPTGDGECDGSTTVPDFTNDVWLICDAVAATGRIWRGTLIITSERASNSTNASSTGSWSTAQLSSFRTSRMMHCRAI